MKSKWILTLTAAAAGMSLLLAGCGNGDKDMSSGSSSHSSKPEESGTRPSMGDDNSMTDSTGGLGDFTGSQIGAPTDGQNASR